MVALLMTAFTFRSSLFRATAAPRVPLWAALLDATPAPPVNQFMAAAPAQAPVKMSSVASFFNLPAPPSGSVRFTLSITVAVWLLFKLRLTLPAAAILNLLCAASLFSGIGSYFLKFQLFLVSPVNVLFAHLATGQPITFCTVSVMSLFACVTVLFHWFTISKPAWFSELETPSTAKALMVPLFTELAVILVPVTLPLSAPPAVAAPNCLLAAVFASAKFLSMLRMVPRSAASLRAAASVFSFFILFFSSTLLLTFSSDSVSVIVVEAFVPLSPITVILLASCRFIASPAPTVAVDLALPRARPPARLNATSLLLAASETASVALNVASSSTSIRLLLPPS